MSLLEEAKKVRINKVNNSKYFSYTDEHIELIVAWFNGIITAKQMSTVLGMKTDSGNYLYFLASTLKQSCIKKLVKIEKL